MLVKQGEFYCEVPRTTPMNYEEYRQHMTEYSNRCAALSFVQYSNPDYMMIAEAGPEIIPFLLQDLVTQNEHGSAPYTGINVHAIMTLLARKATDPIVVPEDKRGRVQWLKDTWIQWGVDHGFLAPALLTPVTIRTERKWDFWMDNWALCFGDRSIGKAHTQIGFAIVLLLGWGVYWLLKHL